MELSQDTINYAKGLFEPRMRSAMATFQSPRRISNDDFAFIVWMWTDVPTIVGLTEKNDKLTWSTDYEGNAFTISPAKLAKKGGIWNSDGSMTSQIMRLCAQMEDRVAAQLAWFASGAPAEAPDIPENVRFGADEGWKGVFLKSFAFYHGGKPISREWSAILTRLAGSTARAKSEKSADLTEIERIMEAEANERRGDDEYETRTFEAD